MKEKIVHFTTVHPAFDIRIFHKEAKTLAQAGYNVILIAQYEKEEIVNGVRIIPLPRPKTRLSRFLILTWRTFFIAFRQRAQIYHFHDPELIPVGIALRLTGKKVIYDVHEDLPKQILSKPWIPCWLRPIVAKMAQVLEKIAAKCLNGIVVVTPNIASHFPEKKTVLVQNFPLLSELTLAESTVYSERPLNIAYVGGIAFIRGAIEMVKAMEFLPLHIPAKLFLAGTFESSSLEKKLRTLTGWSRVEYLGWLNRRKVMELLNNVRVGLVIFHPEPNNIESQPIKLFEYMAAGLPVVASDFPLWRQIVQEVGCGLLVDPLDPKTISRAITWLLEHPTEAEAMGKRGKQAVLEKYNWEKEAEKLLKFYENLI
ncbi:MAG: glycosyltransferase family 4 protein [Pseudothermotoga sp.]